VQKLCVQVKNFRSSATCLLYERLTLKNVPHISDSHSHKRTIKPRKQIYISAGAYTKKYLHGLAMNFT